MSAQPTIEMQPSDATRRSNTVPIDDDAKVDFEHVEQGETELEQAKKPGAFVIDNYGELSKQHDLSFRATLWQFKRAMTICLGCGVLSMGDGYQYKMPGNIVALPGFIRQMGYPKDDGTYMLDPQHVAAWGGESKVLPPPPTFVLTGS